MRKRPVLQPGDVVRLSKHGLRLARKGGLLQPSSTMIVQSIAHYMSDMNDGRSRVKCSVVSKDVRGREVGFKLTFQRKDLWRTGYNIKDGKGLDSNAMMTTPAGRAWEQGFKAYDKTNKTLTLPLARCTCDMMVLMNQGCQCGGK